jgi:hypothetical protein
MRSGGLRRLTCDRLDSRTRWTREHLLAARLGRIGRCCRGVHGRGGGAPGLERGRGSTSRSGALGHDRALARALCTHPERQTTEIVAMPQEGQRRTRKHVRHEFQVKHKVTLATARSGYERARKRSLATLARGYDLGTRGKATWGTTVFSSSPLRAVVTTPRTLRASASPLMWPPSCGANRAVHRSSSRRA